MTTLPALTSIKADGEEFGWRVERNPQWCAADGWRGSLLHVETIAGGGRTFKIELPFSIRDHRSTPHRQRPKISAAPLSGHIRAELKAGWSPSSRGRPFLYVVDGEGAV
jgi:hypothetical protein